VCCGCACVENQLYLPYRFQVPPSAPKWTVSDILVSSKIDSGNRNLGLLTRLVVAATTVHPIFYVRTFFYKNVEAEINQNFKNVLIKNIPQAESRLRTFLFC